MAVLKSLLILAIFAVLVSSIPSEWVAACDHLCERTVGQAERNVCCRSYGKGTGSCWRGRMWCNN
ncbi:uncharacterized protein LOC125239275 [Leguminivora glycinivorella]|uniref:uncharacterized protein LOC125239275 n=1 Tax=Leguminivora glycinivorella TaxID=1035111 RepID=UPI0020103962|nr:uncharacterized protein LOC125239275 [Leguminivora glycinivorella]